MLKKSLFLFTMFFSALILAACSKSDDSLLGRIKNHGTVKIATEGTYAPFTYHDKNGKLTGYDVEVARLVAEKLGFKIQFEESSWAPMLAGLQAGRFDIVANQVALTTPERRAIFAKSEPYSYSSPVAVVRKDDNRLKNIKNIKGMRSAQSLNSNYGEMAKNLGAIIVPVDGLAEAITLVQQKRADLTFNDSLAVLDYMKVNPDSKIKVIWKGEVDPQRGAGFVAKIKDKEAMELISKTVLELKKEGKLKELGMRFFGADVSE